jgi:hypothetical protein
MTSGEAHDVLSTEPGGDLAAQDTGRAPALRLPDINRHSTFRGDDRQSRAACRCASLRHRVHFSFTRTAAPETNFSIAEPSATIVYATI